jgi:hypothetical protein
VQLNNAYVYVIYIKRATTAEAIQNKAEPTDTTEASLVGTPPEAFGALDPPDVGALDPPDVGALDPPAVGAETGAKAGGPTGAATGAEYVLSQRAP